MPAVREGLAASRSGSGLRRAAEGGDVGRRRGRGQGRRRGRAEGDGRAHGGRRRCRAVTAATADEWDLGEVALGKKEPCG